MGTLGCINDMLQRDKENRELRKRNRERLTEPTTGYWIQEKRLTSLR